MRWYLYASKGRCEDSVAIVRGLYQATLTYNPWFWEQKWTRSTIFIYCVPCKSGPTSNADERSIGYYYHRDP